MKIRRLVPASGRDASGAALVVAIVGILIAAVVIAAVLLLPYRPVSMTESRSVPYHAGVENLTLSLELNVGEVVIGFSELQGELLSLNASVAGNTNLLNNAAPLNLSFEYNIQGGDLAVTAVISVFEIKPFSTKTSICRVLIDESLVSAIHVANQRGGVTISTTDRTTLGSVDLETQLGGIVINLAGGTFLTDHMNASAVTGEIDLEAEDITAANPVMINLHSMNTGVVVHVMQAAPLESDIRINATSDGAILLNLTVEKGTAASIDSSSGTGVIQGNVVGFEGPIWQLQSSNYPGTDKLIINLISNVGAVQIEATYVP